MAAIESFSDETMANDYSDASDADMEGDKSIAKGGVTTPFPWKLHDMLDDMAKEGSHSVVTWQPHGRAFMVHKPKEFVQRIMPHYFNQTKYASFQRQLNLYGFSRLSHGKDKGAYFHMCFVRGERNLCRKMIRQKIKGTKVRRSLSPEEEPNFYQPQWNTNRSSGEANDTTEPTQPITGTQLQLSLPASINPPRSPKQVVSAPEPVERVLSTSLVSMIREIPQNPAPQVIPPPPTIKTLQPSASSIDYNFNNNLAFNERAKAGDLLFFEGRPFRYLEHMEGVPSSTSFPSIPGMHSEFPNNQSMTNREKLQSMLSSVIGMETAWNDNTRNVCSV